MRNYHYMANTCTGTKEAPICLWTYLSKLVTSGFSRSRTWPTQIWLFINCLISIKTMGKSAVSTTFFAIVKNFLWHILFQKLCCGFWGSGLSSHYLVLFCFLLSLSLFYLLIDCSKNYRVSVFPQPQHAISAQI